LEKDQKEKRTVGIDYGGQRIKQICDSRELVEGHDLSEVAEDHDELTSLSRIERSLG